MRIEVFNNMEYQYLWLQSMEWLLRKLSYAKVDKMSICALLKSTYLQINELYKEFDEKDWKEVNINSFIVKHLKADNELKTNEVDEADSNTNHHQKNINAAPVQKTQHQQQQTQQSIQPIFKQKQTNESQINLFIINQPSLLQQQSLVNLPSLECTKDQTLPKDQTFKINGNKNTKTETEINVNIKDLSQELSKLNVEDDKGDKSINLEKKKASINITSNKKHSNTQDPILSDSSLAPTSSDSSNGNISESEEDFDIVDKQANQVFDIGDTPANNEAWGEKEKMGIQMGEKFASETPMDKAGKMVKGYYVFKSHGIEINHEDVKSLDPEEWVTTPIIMAELLEYIKVHNIDDVFIVEPQSVTSIVNALGDNNNMKKDAMDEIVKEFQKKGNALCLVNDARDGDTLGGRHWGFGILRNNPRRAHQIDSLGNTTGCIRVFKHFLKEFETALGGDEEFEYTFIDSTLQKDGCSCGLFVIAYGKEALFMFVHQTINDIVTKFPQLSHQQVTKTRAMLKQKYISIKINCGIIQDDEDNKKQNEDNNKNEDNEKKNDDDDDDSDINEDNKKQNEDNNKNEENENKNDDDDDNKIDKMISLLNHLYPEATPSDYKAALEASENGTVEEVANFLAFLIFSDMLSKFKFIHILKFRTKINQIYLI